MMNKSLFWIFLVSMLVPVAAQAKRPNILFILADDQAPHTMKAYGNTVCQTPHLDRLSAEGVTLTGAYHMGSWSGAVCTPSRTMIMTGINVWRTRGLHKKGAAKSDYNPAQHSLPAVFNQAGYDTFRTRKNGNSYMGANQLFDERHDASCRGGKKQADSQWHADQVMTYLGKRHEARDKDPFLIYFGFSHPHDPRNGRPDLLAKYGASNTKVPDTPNPKAPPLQINYLPEHPFHHGHPGLRDETKVQGVMKNRDEATIRNELGREYACIELIDMQVGRVLAKLKAMGELDNTYVVYTSDHGIAVGRHGLTGKQNLYEHTWRVPLIVRGPGITPESHASGNTYLMDVLPTLCDLAGIEPPAVVDGISFKPVLMGKKDQIRDVLYGVYSGGTKPGIRSVKMGHWKLIKYDVLDGKVRETQLFNLAENPDELLRAHHDPAVIALTGNRPKANQVNLADDPKYANKLADMEALLLSEQLRTGDPYRLWNQPAMEIVD